MKTILKVTSKALLIALLIVTTGCSNSTSNSNEGALEELSSPVELEQESLLSTQSLATQSQWKNSTANVIEANNGYTVQISLESQPSFNNSIRYSGTKSYYLWLWRQKVVDGTAQGYEYLGRDIYTNYYGNYQTGIRVFDNGLQSMTDDSPSQSSTYIYTMGTWAWNWETYNWVWYWSRSPQVTIPAPQQDVAPQSITFNDAVPTLDHKEVVTTSKTFSISVNPNVTNYELTLYGSPVNSRDYTAFTFIKESNQSVRAQVNAYGWTQEYVNVRNSQGSTGTKLSLLNPVPRSTIVGNYTVNGTTVSFNTDGTYVFGEDDSQDDSLRPDLGERGQRGSWSIDIEDNHSVLNFVPTGSVHASPFSVQVRYADSRRIITFGTELGSRFGSRGTSFSTLIRQ